MEEKKKRRVIFVDSENFLGAKKEIQKKLDEIKFFKFLAQNTDTEIYYYISPRTLSVLGENQEKPFIGFMDFLFNVLRPRLEKEGHFFKIFLSRNDIDSKIITDISLILLQQKEKFGEIVLISGDSDFAEILALVKDEGLKTTVVSVRKTCSKRLIYVVDETIYIEDLIEGHPELLLQQ
jgi:uncharacterized LabA/DUF88 family protein